MESQLLSEPPLQRDETLRAIRDIASLLNANNDYYGLLNRLVSTICERLTWSRSAIMILDRAESLSRLVAFCDKDNVFDPQTVSWDLVSSPTLKVAESGVPLILTNAQNDERFPGYREFALRHDLDTIVLLPLSSTDQDGHEMVFSVASTQSVEMGEDALDFLLTISHLISIAVDKYKLFQAEQAVNNGLRALFESNTGLMDLVVGGCTFAELVEAVRRQLRLPFAVSDELSDSFIWSTHPANIEDLDKQMRRDAVDQMSRKLRDLILRQEMHNSPTTIKMELPCLKAEFDVIILPLLVSDQTVGGLALFPDKHRSGELDLLLAQGAQQAFSAYLMRMYAPWTQKTTAITSFFSYLFDGDWVSFDQIEGMAQRVGIDLSFPAHFVAVDLLPVIAESMALCHSIEAAARQIIPNCAAFYENQILFVYFPEPKRSGAKTISRLVEEIRSQVKWRTEVAVTVTCSTPCQSQFDFKQVRSHCMQVFRLSRMFQKTGYVTMSDFGSLAILVSALGDTAMTNFLNDVLSPIIEHDRKKNGSLLECAKAFLDNACRYQAAADALGIHVSTLRYRLKRLNELFLLDLENNEDDRFALSLALRIRQLRN
ncbi:helix-turn-helix domain-containing protein [Limibacillus halophilus]|uniref:Purine catabolism regulator n=1 Tax=Limibacillus halophilus TaxID=1579333 RepID=A0A839SS28_9PROT|nr:helix-turn-helix domain-containing protein [Limibacillus halophilus]MBB3064520.1 purine catabolism regulator [Limibacillus halophilus]